MTALLRVPFAMESGVVCLGMAGTRHWLGSVRDILLSVDIRAMPGPSTSGLSFIRTLSTENSSSRAILRAICLSFSVVDVWLARLCLEYMMTVVEALAERIDAEENMKGMYLTQRRLRPPGAGRLIDPQKRVYGVELLR